MPRKSADEIVEHRITLGLKEREALTEAAARAATAQKINSITQISTAGAVLLGGAALALAGYAVYRWAGLPLLRTLLDPEKTSYLWYNYTIVGRYVRDGNTEEAYAKNDAMLQAQMDRTSAILNDPNATENEKAVAAEQQRKAIENHERTNQFIADEHEKVLNKIRAAGTEAPVFSWLFGDTWEATFGPRSDV